MSSRLWSVFTAAALLAITGCSSAVCDTTADCADRGSEFVCVNSTCVRHTPPDAGSDGGATDGGPDAGLPDGGLPDGGLADAGSDGGTTDGGTTDGGTTDGGTTDGGMWCLDSTWCGGSTPACDEATHQCVECTPTDTHACGVSEVCNANACVATDVGSATADLEQVIATAQDGGAASGLDLPVEGVLVTYLKPSEASGDPAGFFVQAQKSGPGLWVASTATVDVGDRVRFTVTGTGMRGQLPYAAQISGLELIESGHDVGPLATDVSSVDLTNAANLDAFQGRLITLTADAAENPSAANTGYEQMAITSAGVPGVSTNFDLYAPSRVFSGVGLRSGCTFELSNGVLWRYYAKAEPALWSSLDLTITGCATLTVTQATALDATHVRVGFNRPVDGNTVSAGGFGIGGLSVLSATLDASGTSVTLTTSTQASGGSYTVTVSGVAGTGGIPLGSPSSASFSGYLSGEAQLRLTEVDPAMTSNGGDTLELVAVKGGTTQGLEVKELVGNTVLATLPALTVATGETILIHLGSGACAETSTPSDCPAATYGGSYDDGVWDIGGSNGLTWSSRVVSVMAGDGSISDAVPFTNPGYSPPSGFSTTVSGLESAGLWRPFDGGVCSDDSSCTYHSVLWNGASSDGTVSVQHVATFKPKPDDKTDWATVTSGWGSFPAGAPDGGHDIGGGSSDGGTLVVGEWNVEWFGDPSNGPTDDDLQESNVSAVMADAGLDLWGVEEVVDYARFRGMVSALPGGYASVLAKDTDVAGRSSYSGTQQVGVVYKTSEISVTGKQIILGSNSYDFAGRPPLEVALSVRGTPLYLIVLHMKAFNDSTSRDRREAAAVALKSYLDTNRANDRVMVLGDWNDDIDASITSDGSGGYLASPYAALVSDSSDYAFATSNLTSANTSTTATNFGNGPIDHHLITNELFGNLVSGSATVLHPSIPSYSSTTTDHYPVVVQYAW